MKLCVFVVLLLLLLLPVAVAVAVAVAVGWDWDRRLTQPPVRGAVLQAEAEARAAEEKAKAEEATKKAADAKKKPQASPPTGKGKPPSSSGKTSPRPTPTVVVREPTPREKIHLQRKAFKAQLAELTAKASVPTPDMRLSYKIVSSILSDVVEIIPRLVGAARLAAGLPLRYALALHC